MRFLVICAHWTATGGEPRQHVRFWPLVFGLTFRLFHQVDLRAIHTSKDPSDNDSYGTTSSGSGSKKKARTAAISDDQGKKGVAWSEEEHRLFLAGLAKFGKGSWRSISRQFVMTRTPTQVASHAQKYFLRASGGNKKEKRRASIHDMSHNVPTIQHVPPLNWRADNGFGSILPTMFSI